MVQWLNLLMVQQVSGACVASMIEEGLVMWIVGKSNGLMKVMAACGGVGLLQTELALTDSLHQDCSSSFAESSWLPVAPTLPHRASCPLGLIR
jgi:hypothetical protein